MPDDHIPALWRRDRLLAKRQAEITIEMFERDVRQFRESLAGRSLSEATRIDVEMFVTTKLETWSHEGRMAQRSLRSLCHWLLSRLNRTRTDEDGTLTLDFRNDADEIRRAFEDPVGPTLTASANGDPITVDIVAFRTPA